MELGRNIIEAGIKNIHLITVPTGGMLVDMLIGSQCVSSIETSGVSLGEFGPAPRFTEAIKGGSIELQDSTCPAIYAGLQAAEKGNPFMPLRGLLGTDILKHRSDYKTIDNPFEPHDKIVCLPAIKPDFAIFHAPIADHLGNVYLGRQQELKLLAHVSQKTLVTVEEITDTDLLRDPSTAPATLSAFYVSAIAKAAYGSRPFNLPNHYEAKLQEIQRYAAAAKTEEGFSAWLSEYAKPACSVT